MELRKLISLERICVNPFVFPYAFLEKSDNFSAEGLWFQLAFPLWRSFLHYSHSSLHVRSLTIRTPRREYS